MSKRMIYGAMGVGGDWQDTALTENQIKEGISLLEAVVDLGITQIDSADIYRLGKTEKVIGHFLNEHPSIRKSLYIQSKLGIRLNQVQGSNTYDLSKKYIIESVEKILLRMNTDYLDRLLFHRIDPLMTSEALYEAVNELFEQGLIKGLGVSNMNEHQIKLIEHYTGRPVEVNQLELSLDQSGFVDKEFGVNNDFKPSHFSEGLMAHCIINGIELQSWRPLCQGKYSGNYHGVDKKVLKQIELVTKIARAHGVSNEAVVLGWVMRHPAHIKPVIGTTNIKRIQACLEAEKIQLSRHEWYELYIEMVGKHLP